MVGVPVIDKKLQSARRYRDIFSVLVRYGFEDVVLETGIDRWLASTLGERVSASVVSTDARLPRATRLRKALEDLGPIFIKLGQILSTRPDLIPLEWSEEFRRLQSECPTVPYPEIREVLDRELGDLLSEKFDSIDETPLAAASLAQVHPAVLRSGEQVVLKILRPGVRKLIEADLDVMRNFAQFLENHFQGLGYSPVGVVEEFARELSRETDLIREARSTERLRALFADDNQIRFPRVFWETSNRSVLTLERIDGVLLSKFDKDSISVDEKKAIMRTGTSAVLRQGLEFGFFHADPHPGNVFILEDHSVCFIDCGMVGELDRNTSSLLADLIAGVARKDLDRVTQSVVALTSGDASLIDDRSFRAETWRLISQFDYGTLESIQVGPLLNQLFELFRKYEIRCPSDIVFLIKAVTTIEGVAEDFCPDFDIVSEAEPFVEKLVGTRFGFRALRERVESSARDYAEFFEEFPRTLQSILEQVRKNQLSMSIEHRGLSRLTHALDNASRNISNALLLAALMVGSSILILAASLTDAAGLVRTVGLLGVTVSLVLGGLFLVRNIFRK